MKFKKGNRVEVLVKREVHAGAWYPAEIVLRDGRYYYVKYDNAEIVRRGDVAEKVSRKAVRPCPPLVEGVKSWTVGDIVEVFVVCSWRVATILETFSRNKIHVRLLGHTEEYMVHMFDIRVCQLWQDGKWIVLTNGSGSSENVKFGKVSVADWKRDGPDGPSLPSGARTKLKLRYDCLDIQRNTGLKEYRSVSSRTLKRAPPYESFYLEAYTGKRQKLRTIEEQGECCRVISGYQSPLLNKVDAVAYPRERFGKTCLHSSFVNQTLGYYEKNCGKLNDRVSCSFGKFAERNDSNSDASSVGSCSVDSFSPNKLRSHNLAVYSREADMLASDAESFSGRGDLDENSTSLPSEENFSENIHRLELDAYKRTLGALYASGPLTWEQEALLTTLRIDLHISPDEYSRELRNLISGGMNTLGQHCGYASLASKMMHEFAAFVLA